MADTKDEYADGWMAAEAETISNEKVTPAQDAVSAARESASAEYSDAFSKATAEPQVSKEPKSFKTAFAEARSAGQKQFEWQGKKYTTEMKSAAKEAKGGESREPTTPYKPAASAKAPYDPGNVGVPDSSKMVAAPVKESSLASKEPAKTKVVPNRGGKASIGSEHRFMGSMK